jgi:small conductance mechanosensitive channel
MDWTTIWHDAKNTVIDAKMWLGVAVTLIQIVGILIIGRFVVRVARRTVETFVAKTTVKPDKFDLRRTQTIGKLVSSVLSYVLNFIIILLVLDKLGIPIMPLLAGASVLGLAVGFGAQSIVKDVLNGFFIIFEDQFGVGDVIQTSSFKGTVEQIGLRTTKIKSWTGEQYILPNGTITDVTNYSIYNAMAVCDLVIAYDANIEQALEVLHAQAKVFEVQEPELVGELQVLGVQALNSADVTLRVVGECTPNNGDGVARRLKARLKTALEQAGIALPAGKKG